jgi:uncharacterized protein YfeS
MSFISEAQYERDKVPKLRALTQEVNLTQSDKLVLAVALSAKREIGAVAQVMNMPKLP